MRHVIALARSLAALKWPFSDMVSITMDPPACSRRRPTPEWSEEEVPRRPLPDMVFLPLTKLLCCHVQSYSLCRTDETQDALNQPSLAGGLSKARQSGTLAACDADAAFSGRSTHTICSYPYAYIGIPYNNDECTP